MSTQKGIARLASVYAMMERIRSVELRDSASAVDDAKCSSAVAAALRESQVAAARDALTNGSREDWQVAETTRGAVETRIIYLAKLRAELSAAMQVAEEKYRLSRLSMEQMDRVVDRRRVQDAVQSDKLLQAESDDRFASRRAWLNAHKVDTYE